MSLNADDTLDTRGLFCPEPVMLLHKKVRELADGALVQVIATDPSTERDIPRFCQFLGHELVERSADEEGIYNYWIRVCAQ